MPIKSKLTILATEFFGISISFWIFKSTFNNGKTRLNAALYDMDWDDMQLGFYDVTLSKLALIDNVGKASSKGY